MDFLSNIDFVELFGKLRQLIGKVDWNDLLKAAKPVLNRALDVLKKSPSILLALTVFLTLLGDPGAANTSTSILVSEQVKTMIDASCMNEGLTSDYFSYYYTSGSLSFAKYTALAKYEIGTMKRMKYKIFPVNWDLIKKGYDHIGGISYYNGKLYAAMESAGGNAPPCIAVFSADTLSYETSYDLPASWFPNGIAWVAVDASTGYLYTAAKSNAESIHAFQINATMAHVVEIDLADGAVLKNVNGGEFYDGVLYLSCDTHSSRKEVVKVDVKKGVVTPYMTREVGNADAVAGDITVFPSSSDGSLVHVTDYNGILGVYLRNYIEP